MILNKYLTKIIGSIEKPLVTMNVRWLIVTIISLVLTPSTTYAELCGIDAIFINGYEAPTFVPTVQLKGGLSSPGLTQNIIGSGNLSVTITSPSAGASTSDRTIDVRGTFVGPTNTGIIVNSMPAHVTNGKFLVSNVPLNNGLNTLNVTATTLPGATVSTSGSVTRTGMSAPLSIQTDSVYGYAPFTINFTFTIGTLTNDTAIQSIGIDFNGDGNDDYSSNSLVGAPTSYTYNQPGLYTTRFQVTDINNLTYTTYRSSMIQDFSVQRGMLCDVYGYLKDRLNASDVSKAGASYHADIRSDYVNFFNQLGTAMPTAAQQLGVIVNGQLGSTFADLLLVRDNPDQTRSGYPLRLTIGADGVWRISDM